MLPLLLAVSIWTSQGDNSRINSNPAETTITRGNVASLGLVGSLPVDGAAWGQPLVFNGAVFVCTMHDSCYAFDEVTGAQRWHAGPFATSRTSYPDNGGHINYGQEIGCLSTPVIDTAAGRIYVVCATSAPAWVLYSLDTGTGALVGSVTISGQVPGTGDTGDCTSGANVAFCPAFALQRAGLGFQNGTIYIAFSSFGDARPFHGWLMTYSTGLVQTGIFCTTPNGWGGSIWQGAGAPPIDEAGNVYATTGNGTYDGVSNFAQSALKLSPAAVLLDWFTPANYAAESAADLDLASGRPMLIPGTGLLVFGSKDFNVYSLQAGCMGHLQGTTSCTSQIFVTNPLAGTLDDGIFGGVYGNGIGYFPTVAGSVYSFPLTGSTWGAGIISPGAYPFPGAQMALAGGLLWAMTGATSAESAPAAGTLRALDPVTLAEIWNSGTFGTLAKFASPTIANGRVYAPTLDSRVQVFGLIAPPSVTLRTGTLRTGTLR